MSKFVLITSGAGFIGSYLADELIAHGYRVQVLDNLLRQVHDATPQRPQEFLKALGILDAEKSVQTEQIFAIRHPPFVGLRREPQPNV